MLGGVAFVFILLCLYTGGEGSDIIGKKQSLPAHNYIVYIAQ